MSHKNNSGNSEIVCKIYMGMYKNNLIYYGQN